MPRFIIYVFHADGAAQGQILLFCLEHIAEGGQQPLAPGFHQLFVGNAPHDDHKFVAADPGDDVLAAEELLDLPGGLGQHRIAEEVTVAVVDFLEIIQVDDQHGAADPVGKLGEVFFGLSAAGFLVQQFGKGIQLRPGLEGLLCLLFRVDVDNDAGNFQQISPGIPQGGGPEPAPDIPAAAVYDPHLRNFVAGAAADGSDPVKQQGHVVGMEQRAIAQHRPDILRIGEASENLLPGIGEIDAIVGKTK